MWPKSSDKCPYKRKGEEELRQKRLRSNDGVTGQGAPEALRSWKRQEGPTLVASGVRRALLTLNYGLPASTAKEEVPAVSSHEFVAIFMAHETIYIIIYIYTYIHTRGWMHKIHLRGSALTAPASSGRSFRRSFGPLV